MERESFVFYRSFYEGIKELPRDIQGEVLTAIMEYGLNGVTTENQKPITKAMFALIKPQLDANNQRFENGKRGGRPKADCNQTETETKPKQNRNKTKLKPNHNQTETKPEPNVNDNVNVNDNDISFLKKETKSACEKKIDSTENENSFVEDLGKTSPQVAPAPPPDSEDSKKTKKRFVPPTPKEVQDYCNERGNGISGTEFCDFYTSKGWKVGREPMKDWKAAVRTWEAKRKNNTQTNQTITIDEYGNRITNAGNSNTNTSTPYVFGRQTAEDLRANLSGW